MHSSNKCCVMSASIMTSQLSQPKLEEVNFNILMGDTGSNNTQDNDSNSSIILLRRSPDIDTL